MNTLNPSEILSELYRLQKQVENVISLVRSDESSFALSKLKQIESVVAEHYNINPNMMFIFSRRRTSSWPRFIAVALAAERVPMGWQALADHYGYRSHKSIGYACDWVRKRSQEHVFGQRMERMRQLLNEKEEDHSLSLLPQTSN